MYFSFRPLLQLRLRQERAQHEYSDAVQVLQISRNTSRMQNLGGRSSNIRSADLLQMYRDREGAAFH